MWGSGMFIGTCMQDPITKKIFVWNGTKWGEFEDIEVIIDFDTSNAESVFQPSKKNLRGRPPSKIPKKTRAPSKYNMFLKTQLLSEKYPHLSGRERLKMFAIDWKSSKTIDQ